MFLGQHPLDVQAWYAPGKASAAETTAAAVAGSTNGVASPCKNKVDRHRRDKMENNLILQSFKD